MKFPQRAVISTFVLCNFIFNYSFARKPCNDFLDTILIQLKEDKEFFQEPYEISYDDKSFGIYNIESGYIYGLNTLHRLQDVVPLKKGTTHLKVYLGAGELRLQCSLKKKVLHLGKPIDIVANIPFISMELTVVPQPDGSSPKITDFSLDEVKGLSFKATGLGKITSILYNAYLRLVGRFFKKMVRNGVEERLRNFLTNKVKDFKVPKECLNDAWE